MANRRRHSFYKNELGLGSDEFDEARRLVEGTPNIGEKSNHPLGRVARKDAYEAIKAHLPQLLATEDAQEVEGRKATIKQMVATLASNYRGHQPRGLPTTAVKVEDTGESHMNEAKAPVELGKYAICTMRPVPPPKAGDSEGHDSTASDADEDEACNRFYTPLHLLRDRKLFRRDLEMRDLDFVLYRNEVQKKFFPDRDDFIIYYARPGCAKEMIHDGGDWRAALGLLWAADTPHLTTGFILPLYAAIPGDYHRKSPTPALSDRHHSLSPPRFALPKPAGPQNQDEQRPTSPPTHHHQKSASPPLAKVTAETIEIEDDAAPEWVPPEWVTALSEHDRERYDEHARLKKRMLAASSRLTLPDLTEADFRPRVAVEDKKIDMPHMVRIAALCKARGSIVDADVDEGVRDDEEDGGDEESRRARTALMNLPELSRVHSEPEIVDEACEFFRIPREFFSLSTAGFRPRGMRKGKFLKMYQILAVWVHVKWSKFPKNGGFLCDEMGFGKTLEGISIIIMLYQIQRAYLEVRKERRGLEKDPNYPTEHLPKDHDEKLQCPKELSGKYMYDFQCPCHRGSIVRRFNMIPTEGPALIIAPPNLTTTWIKEIPNFYDLKALDMYVLVALSKDNNAWVNQIAATPRIRPLEKEHGSVLVAKEGETSPPPNSTKYMVVSNRQALRTQLWDKVKDIKFGRLLYDEYHLDAGGEAGICSKFNCWTKKPSFVFLTGTLIDNNPTTPLNALRLMQSPLLVDATKPGDTRVRGEFKNVAGVAKILAVHWGQIASGQSAITNTISKQARDRADKVTAKSRQLMEDAMAVLEKVVRLYVFRRTTQTLWLDGKPAVAMPAAEHFRVCIPMDRKHKGQCLTMASSVTHMKEDEQQRRRLRKEAEQKEAARQAAERKQEEERQAAIRKEAEREEAERQSAEGGGEGGGQPGSNQAQQHAAQGGAEGGGQEQPAPHDSTTNEKLPDVTKSQDSVYTTGAVFGELLDWNNVPDADQVSSLQWDAKANITVTPDAAWCLTRDTEEKAYLKERAKAIAKNQNPPQFPTNRFLLQTMSRADHNPVVQWVKSLWDQMSARNEKEKLLVFTVNAGTARIFYNIMRYKYGYKAVLINAEMDPTSRAAHISRFQDEEVVLGEGKNKLKQPPPPEIEMMISTYTIMGVGHTCTRAFRVVCLDPPKTQKDLVQAIGRAHRVNQKSAVVYSYLLYRDTPRHIYDISMHETRRNHFGQ